MKRGPKGEILILVDNDPQGYELSWCGNFGLLFFSFLQIVFGHVVRNSSM